MQENSYLCKFIASHPNWRMLLDKEPYSIHINNEGDLSIFNYRMIDAPDFTLPETQEARGIILDTKKLNVVCWPFRKFGNYGETYADTINWDTARVQEKIDGSIMKLWYKDGWHLSSNAAITPKTGEDIADLASLFYEAVKEQHLQTKYLDHDTTYIFELTSPENRVVLQYDKPQIWHIGTRNNRTGVESNPNIGIQKPKEYPLTSLNDCIAAANTLNKNGLQHEGFVVVDNDWHRIKVKTPEYLMAAHMSNSGNTLSDIIAMVRMGEESEYLSYFPEQKKQFDDVKKTLDDLHDFIAEYQIDKIDQYHEACKDNRKEFAILLQSDPHRSWAFDAIDKETMDPDIRAEQIVNRMSDKQAAKELHNFLQQIDVSDIKDTNNKENILNIQ